MSRCGCVTCKEKKNKTHISLAMIHNKLLWFYTVTEIFIYWVNPQYRYNVKFVVAIRITQTTNLMNFNL